MNCISATNFVSILKTDGLYSGPKMLASICNSIAIRHHAYLRFHKYYYGIPHSLKPNDSARGNMAVKFDLYDYDLKKEACRIIEIFNKGIETGEDFFEATSGKEKLLSAINNNARPQVEFLLTMLATGMEFLHKDKILILDPEGLHEFFQEQCDGCSLEALKLVGLRDVGIESYFYANLLPLPEALFSQSKYSSVKFAKEFPRQAWDKYEPYDNFTAFYSTAKAAIPVEIEPMESAKSTPPSQDGNAYTGTSWPFAECTPQNAFYRSGDTWAVRFQGNGKHYSDRSIGFAYIHEIIKAGKDGITPYDIECSVNGLPVALDEERRLFNSTAEDDGYSRLSASQIKMKNIDTNSLHKAIDAREQKLKADVDMGDIGPEEYAEKIEQLKIDRAKINGLNNMHRDKNQKRIGDRVSGAILEALKRIKEAKHIDLHEHLKHVSRRKDSKHCYQGDGDLKWKLYE